MSQSSAVEQAARLVEIITKQEDLIAFPHFSPDDAFALGSLIRSKFLEHYSTKENGIAISVELFNGDVLFRASVGNKKAVTVDNWSWIAAKIRTVTRHSKSSFLLGRTQIASGKPFQRFGQPPIGADEGQYVYHGGGVPIWVKGITVGPIGVVAVSGLPQEVDHQLVVDAISEHFGIQDVPSVLS